MSSWLPGQGANVGQQEGAIAGWEVGDPSCDVVKQLDDCLGQPWKRHRGSLEPVPLGAVVEKGQDISVGCFLTFLVNF